MKRTKKIHFSLLLVSLLLVFSFGRGFAEGELSMQQKIVEFSAFTLSLEDVLKELDRLPEINVVHGNIDKYLKIKIKFSSKKLTIDKAAEEIMKFVPVTILLNGNHIIVKEKELSTHYLLKGSVRDASTREYLTGASMHLAGTNTGVVTDNEGHFLLKLPPGSYRLVCRFIGYEEASVDIDLFHDQTVDFLLQVKDNEIREVNIRGSYTELENLEKGRPIETIESKTIGRLNTNDVNDALHGRINGVWNTKVSGAPGDHHRIRIRGINSIFGCSDPLYVVDGSLIPIVNFDNIGISDLNAHDIDKITVLKDASSTALYGNLGTNGVILIETKKGGGNTQFNFGVKMGLQTFSKRYDLMNAENFLNTLQLNDDRNKTDFYRIILSTEHYEEYPRYLDSLGNALAEDDFQDELFQTGFLHEYRLSASGKVNTFDYYLSGNYYSHDGVITNSNYTKYTLTANLSKVIEDKLSVRLLYKGSYQENKNTLDNFMGNNVIFKGINYEPAYRATPDSFLNKIERLYYNDVLNASVASLANHPTSPDELFYEHNKIKTDKAHAVNLQGFYKLNREISFRALLSLTIRNQVNLSNIQKSYSNYDYPQYYIYERDRVDFGEGNRLKSDETFIYFCQHYDVNYTKQFNNHLLNVLFRYRNYKDNAYWEIDSVSNVYYDQINPTDDVFLRGSQAIFGEKGSVLRSVNSGIINVNYQYKKKYFVSFIANYESIKENEYFKKPDLFYSVALSWDLAKEDFLKMPHFVDALNLRANLGRSGNFPLNSLADDLFTYSGEYTANGQAVDAVYISNLANANLRPESVVENNFGAEVSLFKERLIVTADYYQKHYSDLLIKRSIPLYYGGGTFYQNIGEMKNEGLELSLDVVPVETQNFYWNSRLGLSTNQQRITKLLDSTSIKFNYTDVLIPDFIAKENEVLGSITGYKYMGKWSDTSGEMAEGETYFNDQGLAYLKLDTLNMKSLTENDKTIIGNSIPDLTFHWINNIEYKNFSFEMMWYGAIGVDKYNATKASTYISGLNANVRDLVLDSMKYNSSGVFYESSFFVEDASFIRLKTVTFSYRPTKKLASRIGMEFSLSFENLITLTTYSGYDPEAAIYTKNNFSDNAIDKGAYPNPTGVYFSINLTY
ncbi:MAG TPA: SusC/RagA family TonB-linked outer membrane protein [Prolixibacteraceae bacterium]|nr:SusC/RagA family TonB-linked outer membrane protein [Prolixibacteraceae bacterium]